MLAKAGPRWRLCGPRAFHELVELDCHAAGGEEEATVYVKGFLARGESPSQFERWHRCHRQLALSHRWRLTSYGYRWQSGDASAMGEFPLSFPAPVVAAVQLYRLSRSMSLLSPASVLAWGTAEAAAQAAAQLLRQYLGALTNAREHAEFLAQHLSKLHGRHGRVRLVCHSLGCLHALEALRLLPPAARPRELHLCAPAVTEERFLRARDCLPQRTALYHTGADSVLAYAFAAMAADGAVGSAGLSAEGAAHVLAGAGPGASLHRFRAPPAPGLAAPAGAGPILAVVDATACFDLWCHGEYRSRFHTMAVRFPADAPPPGPCRPPG